MAEGKLVTPHFFFLGADFDFDWSVFVCRFLVFGVCLPPRCLVYCDFLGPFLLFFTLVKKREGPKASDFQTLISCDATQSCPFICRYVRVCSLSCELAGSNTPTKHKKYARRKKKGPSQSYIPDHEISIFPLHKLRTHRVRSSGNSTICMIVNYKRSSVRTVGESSSSTFWAITAIISDWTPVPPARLPPPSAPPSRPPSGWQSTNLRGS